ncbi:GNAT family N-acetyltransferase [Rathayibacter toxicus]|uniref:GNAT family N-acetyltransferase n=2 Tax=Rathayibacter toxicus TaxID=145458 RepID=A0A2S5Y8V0_9MICO|nr:hypothetical protein TI83_02895 [Rathayibacter toxicus]PPG23168.1 GNAT family N-acetyltransferase [Rathayibacter toxicus]PPG47751.1 GNAT family N-acetyltransferase [Rathayibacter toxicus]PPH24894.1 GNAT family N-acetyltransferase [Rathayibacter toxicus]PPH58819.1 GNAT family N-acetyltransferase [Rathayibacter toxicus]
MGVVFAHSFPRAPTNLVYNARSVLRGALRDHQLRDESWTSQLLLGGRNGQRNGFYVASTKASERRQILRLLIDESFRLEASSAAFLYLDEESAAEILSINDDCVPVPAEPDSYIRLREPSLESYLTDLSSKQRYDVTRDLRRAGGYPASHRVQPDDAARIAIYAELAASTQHRHGLPADPGRLANYIARCAGAGAEAIAFYVGDESSPAAFSLAVVYGDTLWVRMVGMEYGPVGDTSGAYAGVLIYGPVKWAAERGLANINVGGGVRDFKRRRGAIAEPRWSLIRPPKGIHPDSSYLARFIRESAAHFGNSHSPLVDTLITRYENKSE